MALSYDPTIRMTTGFLGLTTGQMSELLEILDMLKLNATHPILLPILMYSVCSTILGRQLQDVKQDIDYVQQQTGLLGNYLRSGRRTGPSEKGKTVAEKPNYDALHKILVVQHARLTRGLSDFVADLGPACREAITKIEQSDTGISIISKTSAHKELQSYLSHLETGARFELQHRERMLSRVDIQLKVVRNIHCPSIQLSLKPC
jgi:hypothetical protein